MSHVEGWIGAVRKLGRAPLEVLEAQCLVWFGPASPKRWKSDAVSLVSEDRAREDSHLVTDGPIQFVEVPVGRLRALRRCLRAPRIAVSTSASVVLGMSHFDRTHFVDVEGHRPTHAGFYARTSITVRGSYTSLEVEPFMTKKMHSMSGRN